MSVEESIRMLIYIQSHLLYLMNKYRSIKHAQMMIFLLVKPILEIVRNIIRNLTLEDVQHIEYTIEMEVKPLSCASSLCAAATYDLTKFGDVLILAITTNK
ncbi:unnamed protein product [Adineta steineri]|uniref:Uncharacterized protein n=1 Tax=Adineta steineri TaxID=433720 RepID=A0A815XWF1_9BILA|nr:unnamed protein product [Adineta steineri]CAF1563496.1 unnamed protein product [Adineta steineri]